MLRATGLAVLFIFVCLLLFSLVAPILFHGADMQRIGYDGFFFIVALGFVLGWVSRKQKK